MNFADRAERQFPKFFGVHLAQDRHHADEMMRHFRERGRIRLGGQQIEPAINLKRVGADNFGIKFARDGSRQLRFAGGGRTDNKENVFQIKKTSNAEYPTSNIECRTLTSTFNVQR
jgi:hypothetical protein